jgi:tetratricopeptide (TPR) repeat protein
VAKLALGDLAGALAQFKVAHRLEPRFADPLKDWGDVLVRQRMWGEALAVYDAALADAPAWQALRDARDAAARSRR